MRLKTLLFVSASLIERAGEAEQLRAIVAGGRSRNEALGVHATLVAARGLFAEVLDGPEDSLRTLMASIRADPRHEHLRVVLEQDARIDRPGPGMDLVYEGDSFYVARYITPLLDAHRRAAEQATLASQLLFLIRELAKSCRP
jgi:hypothetical protein